MQTLWLWNGLLLTLTLWSGAMVIGLVVAVPIVAASRSRQRLLRGLAELWGGLWRGVPNIVWIFLIFFGLGWGPLGTSAPFAAIIALGLISSAYLADCLRAGLDAVPRGQWEASTALGMPRVRIMRYVIAPQATPIGAASCATYSITLLKNTSLASLIGANELLWQANNLVQTARAGTELLVVVGLVYIALAAPIGLFARLLEQRAVAGSGS